MTSGDATPGWANPSSSAPPPVYVPPPRIAPAPPPFPPPPPAPLPPRPLPPPPVSAVPGGVVYGLPYPPPLYYPPPPPPPTRHSVLRWFVVAVCALFILAFGTVGAVVAINDATGPAAAAWRAASPFIAPPAQNAPSTEWNDWARRAVNELLRDQADALVNADEKRFLAAVDPDNAQLLADLQRRFQVLTEMGVGQWKQQLKAAPKPVGERLWRGEINISYCFGAKTCSAVGLVVDSRWEFKNDRLTLVDLTPSDSEHLGPRPWEVDELAVGTGERVVVAASRSNAWRVPDAVVAADKAAKVADAMAKWEPPPSRFVIFLASDDDWSTWYGHEQPDWAAAWAVPVSDTVTEVVVRTDSVQQRGLEQLLTHELTHVTSLAGKRDGATRNNWWLIEGIADYATMINKPVADYDALPPTRSFVRGRWNGDPAVDPPSTTASLEEASARYGVAFLAVRRVAEVYGQDKMLAFFGKVVHDNVSAEAAAPQVLGADWSTVRSDCAQYIRSATA